MNEIYLTSKTYRSHKELFLRNSVIQRLNIFWSEWCKLLERYKGKKVKVKIVLEQATKAQRGSRGIAPLFLQPRRNAPAALPPGKTRYPLYRRTVGSQGRSGRVGKISPPPPTGIRPADRPARSDSLHLLSYRPTERYKFKIYRPLLFNNDCENSHFSTNQNPARVSEEHSQVSYELGTSCYLIR